MFVFIPGIWDPSEIPQREEGRGWVLLQVVPGEVRVGHLGKFLCGIPAFLRGLGRGGIPSLELSQNWGFQDQDGFGLWNSQAAPPELLIPSLLHPKGLWGLEEFWELGTNRIHPKRVELSQKNPRMWHLGTQIGGGLGDWQAGGISPPRRFHGRVFPWNSAG